MTILLIGNYLPDGQESMQRFARVLVERLPALGVGTHLLRPTVRWGRWAGRRAGWGKWLGYVDKFVLFPRRLRQVVRWHRAASNAPFAVHICDHSNAVYTRFLKDVPHVVTCHDLLAVRAAQGEFADQATGWPGRQLQRLILDGLRRAQRITCDSEATAQDARRLLGVSGARVDVTEIGLNYPFAPMPPEKATRMVADWIGSPPVRFLLHVGGNQWYKNRLGLLRIYACLTALLPAAPALVMVGKPFTREMRRFVAEAGLGSRVIPVCDCPDETLRALYSLAELLVFPSLHEGFGWPIAEAQACGCRVVTSDRAPMTSVGGSAAMYLDPTQTECAAWVVNAALSESPELRQEHIHHGLENAVRFAIGTMIQRYAGVYHELVVNPSPARPVVEARAA